MDDELRLIAELLDAIARSGLDPIAADRAVSYLRDRMSDARDEYERELEDERREEAMSEATEQVSAFRKAMALQSGCECADCQRARGQRVFDA